MQPLKTIREVFAYNIRRIRGNMTKVAFSARTGIPLSSLQKMESGTGIVPQKKKLSELVQKLRDEGFKLSSETELFLDPDLIKPDPAQALEVLKEYITKDLRLDRGGKSEPFQDEH